MCLAGLRLGVVAAGVWAGGCAAQTAVDGALAGKVVLSSGQPVARVRVVLRAVDAALAEGDRRTAALPVERVVEASQGGSFLALRLPPGEYEVEATAGTRLLGREKVTVELGVVSEVTLREKVSTVAGAPRRKPISENPDPFDRLKAGCGHTASGAGSENTDPSTSEGEQPASGAGSATNVGAATLAALPLPLEEQRWEEAASLTSSEAHDVAGEPTDSTVEDGETPGAEDEGLHSTDAALLSFRGIAPTQNASLLDGVSGDQGFRGTARGGGLRAQSSFSPGAVRAFRVAPHIYSAQYGGGAGGLLTAASRSGGAALHGGGFYSVRESAWAAKNPFSLLTHYNDGVITNSLVKPHDSLQGVGGRVGGPIAGRRVFGFASIDEQFRGFPAVSSPSIATFYALSATQVALLGNRGVTAAATKVALNYLDSLTGEVPRTANRGSDFVRFDVHASARDIVTGSYSHSRLSSPAGSGVGVSAAVVARGTASLGDTTIRGDATTVRWLRTFSPRLNNEVRGQFATDLEFEQPRPPLAQEPGIGPGGFAPQVSIQGGEFVYGTPASLGRNAYPDERRMQVADVLQWAQGKHLLTFGADWSRVHERIDSLADTDGSFRYDSGATAGRAGGLVDWITDFTFNVRAFPNGGCPSINATRHFFCFRSFTQSFGQQQVEFTTHDFAGFAQDLWRVRPGLTVELGARYEYTLLPLPQRPNVALDAAFRATGATSVFPEDRNNAGPRVAVAWSPHGGRWGTARVGYGVYFGRLPGSRIRAALLDTALPSSATRIHITPTTVTACPQVVNQGFGYPCAYVSAPPAAVAATTSAALFAHNFRLPAVQQAELTLEREWGRGLTVRATYSMAIATQLPNTVDVNIAPATGLGRFVLQGGNGRTGVRDGETFVVPLYSGRVASQFGPVTALESNANATWHAVTVEARLRRPGGFELRGSYTWSKAIDYGPEQGATPRRNGQFDPFSVGYDKGLADANFPQRFVGDAIWRSRLRRGPDALRKALSGWRVSALGTSGSGRSYSYEIFGGTRLSGGSFSINGSGGSAWLPTVGRNTLRLPARWNVDARLGRGFRFTDRLHGEGYVEAFNVANHVNAARVNARAFLTGTAVNGVTPLVFQDAAAVAAEGLNTQAFGTVTSSTSGVAHERHLQVGVRVEF